MIFFSPRNIFSLFDCICGGVWETCRGPSLLLSPVLLLVSGVEARWLIGHSEPKYLLFTLKITFC